MGRWPLLSFILYIMECLFILPLSPFKKFLPLACPFFFFSPTTLLRAKNNPKIIQRVFEGWKEPKQFGQPSCLDTYSNQMFIPLVSCGGEGEGTLQAHFVCPQLWKCRDSGSVTSFSSVCFSFPFFGSCVSWLGAERAFFPRELPRWIRELGEGQANWFQKIVFIWEKAAGG